MNFNLPPVTQTLILVNVVVYLGAMLLGFGLFEPFLLWPIGAGFLPWQLITYGFLHAGLAHLFFNMFAIFMFGSEIERTFGSRWYLIYFLVCVVAAGITQLAVAAYLGARAPTLGASGGVFGLLLAFGMYFPRRTIMLLLPPIPMPAWVFVTVYGLIELYLGVSGRAPGVAHWAHLGGMIGGYLMIAQRRGRWWG